MTHLALIRWLLRLLPRHLLDEYGPDVLELYQVRWREEASAGRPLGAIRYEIHSAVDLIRTACRARRQGAARLFPRFGSRASLLDSLRVDVRQGLRSLRHHPRFTALVVLTFGLGIGAMTTIFSVMDAVLLRPLPYPDPDRLVAIGVRTARNTAVSGPEPEVADAWKRASRQFDGMDQTTSGIVTPYTMTGAGDPVIVRRHWVGPTLFRVLGIDPLIGRSLRPDDLLDSGSRGESNTVVLSYEFWQRHFHGDRSVLGRSVTLVSYPRVIVGVMPPGFRLLPTDPGVDVWMALEYVGRPVRPILVGRLKPGVSRDRATAELQTLLDGRQADTPVEDRLLVSITPLGMEGRETYRSSLYLIAGAVGLVLLICCLNVVGLLLVRGRARAQEIATRIALGAERRRVIRQVLVESVLLASLGGVAGVWLAVLGLQLFVALAGSWYPATETFELNATALAFTLAISLGVGVLTGLAPALAAPGANLSTLVRQRYLRWRPVSPNRAGSLLVTVEVALATILVIAVGLMVSSVARILSVDMGFDPRGLLTAQIRAQGSRYQTQEMAIVRLTPAVTSFFAQLEARLAAEPGVESVGLISMLPVRGLTTRVPLRLLESPGPQPERPAFVQFQEINDDLFKALRVPLVRGRFFTPKDNETSAGVALVNESLARRFFGDQNPIGRMVQADLSNGVKHPGLTADRPREIVGVVADLRLSQRRRPDRTLYVPYRQHLAVYPWAGPWAIPSSWGVHGQKELAIRTSGDPERLIGTLRAAIAAVDDTQLAVNIRAMEDSLAAATGNEQRWMRLLGLCAAIALFLAALGIYGVVSQTVARRTKEIGIRMMLGADRRQVLRLVVRQALTPVFAGVVVGAAAALGVTRVMASILFSVTPTDTTTYVVACVVLSLVGSLACYLPARRSTRIRPVIALRQE